MIQYGEDGDEDEDYACYKHMWKAKDIPKGGELRRFHSSKGWLHK